MITVIVNHEVKNYEEWRKVYNADAPNRSKAGFNVSGVYRSAEKPNSITLIGEVASAEMLHAFFTNPELKAAMEQGGVISEPTVQILNEV